MLKFCSPLNICTSILIPEREGQFKPALELTVLTAW